MLRNVIHIIIVLFVIIIPVSGNCQKSNYTIKKVVIDPGHGGKDPGATVGKTYEKDIVLDVALKTGKMLKKMFPDLVIVYTRDKDVFIPLMDRAEIANKQKADLFISIHVNICSTPSTTGAETYILGQHKTEENLEVAKLENSVILLEDDYSTRYEGFDPNSSESYIMFELLQNEYLLQSRYFAEKIQNHFTSHAKRKDRGVRQAGFVVLKKTAMPSVLVELGFMSNVSEKDFMEREQGKTFLAESIVKSFADFKNRYDNKSEIQEEKKVVKEEIPDAIAADSINDASKLKGKWYGTQIMSVKKRFNFDDPIFKKQKPVFYLNENGLFKYFIGVTQDSEEAYKLFIANQGLFKGSFLVSFDEGIKKSYK